MRVAGKHKSLDMEIRHCAQLYDVKVPHKPKIKLLHKVKMEMQI